MNTRQQITAIWRGSCFILVDFPDQELRQEFGRRSRIKLYWGDECNADGSADTFFTPEDLLTDKTVLLLDLSEIANQYPNWPERMEILYPDETISLSIIFKEKKRPKIIWACPDNQKELLA